MRPTTRPVLVPTVPCLCTQSQVPALRFKPVGRSGLVHGRNLFVPGADGMDWAPGAGRDCTNGAISNSTPSPESKPRHRRGLERLDDVLRDNDNWLAGSGPLWGRQGLGELGSQLPQGWLDIMAVYIFNVICHDRTDEGETPSA